MAKSRSLSIFMLKEGRLPADALDEQNRLQEVEASGLPDRSVVFVLDNPPIEPWWVEYINLNKDIRQASKGAVVFVLHKERWFALCFGHSRHQLNDYSYEHDFGIRVTLNAADPEKLRSTDTLEPGASRRQRTQMPQDSELTLFDFDGNSAILKRLVGRALDKYAGLFKQLTGSSNVNVSTKIPISNVTELLDILTDLYKSDEFLDKFPSVNNIVPVSDPEVIDELDARLVDSIRADGEGVSLSVPDIIYSDDPVQVKYSGEGRSDVFDEVFIEDYYSYLDRHGIELDDIDIEMLRDHRLRLVAEDGSLRKSHSIYRSLIFDLDFPDRDEIYHLSEGGWYKFKTSYVEKLNDQINNIVFDIGLPPFSHENEGSYNESVCEQRDDLICLDRTNMSLPGETQVEPCDIFEANDKEMKFVHVKRSTVSSSLSHLFSQGVVPVKLIRSDDRHIARIVELVRARGLDVGRLAVHENMKVSRYNVAFAIITHKDAQNGASNLPLFSRVNLARTVDDLSLMGVEVQLTYVSDST